MEKRGKAEEEEGICRSAEGREEEGREGETKGGVKRM